MSAADILKMIEEVSPDDAAKLDEIEVLTWRYLTGLPITRSYDDYEGSCGWSFEEDYYFNGGFSHIDKLPHSQPLHKLTRSRDALKAIRPEGWKFDIRSCTNPTCWFVSFRIATDETGDSDFDTTFLPTEELAELHAIISAIGYERTK